MIKALIKSTNEVRVETEDDADNLHKEVQKQANDMKCTLVNFNKALKEKKSKGEVLESWYIVKYTFAFTDAKCPDRFLSSIDYNVTNAAESEDTPW